MSIESWAGVISMRCAGLIIYSSCRQCRVANEAACVPGDRFCISRWTGRIANPSPSGPTDLAPAQADALK
ncbi:MAG: hypothetical protein WB760_33045 [Xanthobacteraceae bacterium]